ncbi:hypothetical protein CDAR_502981 [Caerostris darwini]|uniref:Uncharacterized protein n=1 Tax=Caerostris darwini TaxID=1538125 RepID=A0AAV4T333_9ARAC|nr:hypothetical protein CDAR_502981 [Caerostris darwini]
MATDADLPSPENLPTFERGGLAANEETSATGPGLIPDSRLTTTLNLTTTAENAIMDIDSASLTDTNDDFLHVNYIAILDISGLNRVKYLNREKTALRRRSPSIKG